MSWPEYPGAEDWAVPWGKASDREGTKIDTIFIHVMAGSYTGSMRWAQDPNNEISFHYGVARDGRIGQGVAERWGSWHSGVKQENLRSISLEHEDLRNWQSPGWWTETQLRASAKLTAHLCKKYGIPADGNHIRGHYEVAPDGRKCPGPHWPWDRYMALVRQYAGVTPPKPSPAPPSSQLYRAQSLATKDRARAERQVKTAKRKGFSAAITYEDGLYKVGHFASADREAVSAYVQRLRAAGFDAAIVPVGGKTPPPPPSDTRGPDDIQGRAIYSLEQVVRYATEKQAAKPGLELISSIYEYAPQRNLGADFLAIQMLHETGFGRYGGDSRPYNPAGIKKAGNRGDTPEDFEVPSTANEGARMLVNHWCAVLGLEPIGTPHARFEEARKHYASKPPITRISQLGNGNWATDPAYAVKLKAHLDAVGGRKPVPDVERAIDLGMQLRGTPYGNGWKEGTWPDGPSLYARCDPKVHTIEFIRANELICSALINVLRAYIAGLPAMGRAQGDTWPGGTAAVSRTLARMPGSRPYVPGENVPRGWMCHSPYLGPALKDQGHVGISLGNGYLLEARVPAASSDRRIIDVHSYLISTAGTGWTHVIPPEIWLAQ